MSTRTYGQLCPIARALDVLGDRWTLLVVRELLLGEKRFGEILTMLPAMGTNRLSNRLALLCDNNVVEKMSVTTPASGVAYALTPFGEGLRKPIMDLALWGMSLTSYENEDLTAARAELIALGLSATVDPARIQNVDALYELQVGAETFHARVGQGAVRVRSGPSATPVDVAVRCTLPVFLGLVLGKVKALQALSQGKVQLISGDRQKLTRLFGLLQYRPASARAV